MKKYVISDDVKNSSGKKKDSFDISNILSKRYAKTNVSPSKNRKSSSTKWLLRHINDPFVISANQSGFLSRAIYKLSEMDQLYGLFKDAKKVVDLGAAPGSWMQYIWQKIRTKNSTLIGVDLLDILYKETIDVIGDKLSNNVFFIKGDFMNDLVRNDIVSKLDNGLCDVIVSDIAPNIVGRKKADHLLISEVVEKVIDFSKTCLSADGKLIFKMFDGDSVVGFKSILKTIFHKVTIFKPTASRKTSSEFYFICLQKKSNNLLLS